MNESLQVKAMVIHSHCPYYYLPPVALWTISEHHRLWSQNLGLKSLVSHRVTLALGRVRVYEGRSGWTNNLELPHTRVDHEIKSMFKLTPANLEATLQDWKHLYKQPPLVSWTTYRRDVFQSGIALAPYSNIPLQLGKRNCNIHHLGLGTRHRGYSHHGSVFFKINTTCHKI
jgi:hypothetical protein